MTKLTYNAALIERSAVAKSLVEVSRSRCVLPPPSCTVVSISMQVLSRVKDHSVRLEVLSTIQLFSTTPTNCSHMLSVQLATLVCQVICLPDPNKE